jgi:membrane protease YdiL (CAAX protease family)
MTGEQLRVAISIALLGALLLLRLQAEAFSAAEYDEPDNRYHRGFFTRMWWYVIGFGLLFAIYEIAPRPHDELYLVLGARSEVLTYGFALGACGALLALVLAWFRYGRLRLPSPSQYPGAAINSVFTAIVDEATFRGVLQGMLFAIGLPNGSAILIQTVTYALVTRSAAPGRPRSMLVMAVAIGLAGGWVTQVTEGIGAAILAHSVTSFAFFIFTGHAGHIARGGDEPEERAAIHRPIGWTEVRRED